MNHSELENNERFILYIHIAINTININTLRFRSFCMKNVRYFLIDEIIDQMNRSLFSITRKSYIYNSYFRDILPLPMEIFSY